MAAERRYGVLLAMGLCIASGALLAAALPIYGLAFLGWVAFVPLLLASRNSHPGTAALGGFLSALTCGVLVAGPIESSRQIGNLTAAFGVLGVVFAFVGVSASAGARRLHPMLWPFFVAFAAVTAESLSVYVFPMNVAISQYRNAGMLQIASLTGIWGVSFLLWLASASLVICVRNLQAASPALALCCAALLFSALVRFPTPSGQKHIIAAAIQAKSPSDTAAITSLLPRDVAVAVWPEHVMSESNKSALRAAATKDIYIVASFYQRAANADYNVARLISPRGKVMATFQKQLPFGRENLIFAKGCGGPPVRCTGFTAGALVCFDTQVTDTTRRLVRDGADIILIPNHDPESPNCVFNHLHGAVISFRAAENGVPIVWADSRGLSRIVDGSGRVMTQAPKKAQTAVWASIPLRSGTTVFTRIGNAFAYVCIGAFGICVVMALKQTHRALPHP